MSGTVRSMQGDLRLAQQQALAGKKPAGTECDSPNSLSGYQYAQVSATSYAIRAVCSGGSVEIKPVDLPAGITLSSSVGTITFNVLARGTDLSADATLTLTLAGSQISSTITITPVGEIR